jgi:hypothetical protein
MCPKYGKEKYMTTGREWHINCARNRVTKTNVMPDNKNMRGPRDRSRISLEEDHELRYWTNSLGISEMELRSAISKVGHSASAVKRHLGK